MIKKSIVTKLWLVMAALVVGVLMVLGIALTNLFERFYFSSVAQDLVEKGYYIGKVLNGQGEARAEEVAAVLADENHSTIVIADPNGLIRSCAGMRGKGMGRGMMLLTPEELEEVRSGQVLIRHGLHPRFNVEMLSVVVPVKLAQAENKAVLFYAPLAPLTETAREIRTLVIKVALGAFFLVTILIVFLSRWISRPLLSMNAAAASMIEGDFDQMVEVKSQDEIGMLGRTLNILSQRLKNTLETISYQKNELSNILTSMTEGVIGIDGQGVVTMANPQVPKLLGMEQGPSVGEHISSCCPVKEILEMYRRVNATQSAEQTEVKINDKILAFDMAPLFQEGQNTGVVAVIRDITGEHRLEEMRKEFVANVSHELRTPLFLLQGYGQAIQEGIGGKEAADIIVDEAKRMQRIVDDLLELARFEAGAVQLHQEPIPVQSFLESIKKKFETLVQQKGIALSLEVGEGLSDMMADPDRLSQVLVNLLNNAVKHTPEAGKIHIKAARESDSIRISVSDSGQGISKKELESVWDRFYRVDKGRSRETGGTGLGLSIVRTIVEAHGGKVFVSSEVGKGSTFGFVLPAKSGR